MGLETGCTNSYQLSPFEGSSANQGRLFLAFREYNVLVSPNLYARKLRFSEAAFREYNVLVSLNLYARKLRVSEAASTTFLAEPLH